MNLLTIASSEGGSPSQGVTMLMQGEDKANPLFGPGQTEAGIELSVLAPNAEVVEVCLFDEAGNETQRVEARRSGEVHRCLLRSADFGQRYGWRAHGPYDPGRGFLFDPSKLLLDPAARAVEGEVKWHPSLWSTPGEVPGIDSAPFVPRSVLVDTSFEWGDDTRPRVPWDDTVIYEAHVKGTTKLHPEVPEALRGTYAGFASDAVVEHLTRLGVTSVELLPIAWFLHDKHLVDRGLRNYWGYQPMVFTAPYSGYAFDREDGGVREFKSMVKRLHSAGIEVILDVVFNHTGEDASSGPTLCYRGLDNATYYLADRNIPAACADYTGCGNTLNVNDPRVLSLVIGALKYWAEEMHVDGFRFDLATALGRTPYEFDRAAPFFLAIESDPLLRDLKLIAEPWDLGPDGYQLGRFPDGWSEWNDRYRDAVRDFWTGRGRLPEFVPPGAEYPARPINFVTAHDGFTLIDLVSYNGKHNEANGDANRDGTNENHSWNHGHEGETGDAAINDLRSRQVRNFIASLFIYPGVPMFLAGDELGRTQAGNNNAYCQDNEISWIDWEGATSETPQWVRRMIALRRSIGFDETAHGSMEVSWLDADGRPMDHIWHPGEGAFGFSIECPGGRRHLFAMNPTAEAQSFRAPPHLRWTLAADTSDPEKLSEIEPEQTVELEGRSMQIWAGL